MALGDRAERTAVPLVPAIAPLDAPWSRPAARSRPPSRACEGLAGRDTHVPYTLGPHLWLVGAAEALEFGAYFLQLQADLFDAM